ncbi:MAG: hypothetical protein IPN89_15495, partial [Saprospiraceae bacterium]|nr:hypothetical protein [Saprospiraceae bacterium]
MYGSIQMVNIYKGRRVILQHKHIFQNPSYNTQIGHDANMEIEKLLSMLQDRKYHIYQLSGYMEEYQSWWIYGRTLTNGIQGNGNTELEFLHQSPSDPNVFVVGWGFTQMRRSSDGGQTWNTITKPANTVFNSQVTNIAFHPTDANTMWM